MLLLPVASSSSSCSPPMPTSLGPHTHADIKREGKKMIINQMAITYY